MPRLGFAIFAATVIAVLSVFAIGNDDDPAVVETTATPDPSPSGVEAPRTPDTSVGTSTSAPVAQIPGDARDETPSALDDMNHPAFPPPLVDPGAIRSGGPPPDGIPAIDDPRFQPAAEVTWLADNEPVLFLEVDGEARAYPVQIMTWHEIVNDTVAGMRSRR